MSKTSKLDAFLKTTDKVMESKGVSKLTNTLDKSLGIVTSAFGAASDVAKHEIDVHAEKHKDDVKVPDLKGLNRTEAEALLDQLGLLSAFVEITEPADKYAKAVVNTVETTKPKANVKVPAGSFVKVMVVSETLIQASQVLVADAEQHKADRKTAVVNFATKLGHGTAHAAGKVVTATTGISKKLTNKTKRPKVIDAEFIEVDEQTKE